MTQLCLPFAGVRLEFPAFRMTWRDGDVVRVWAGGEHCVDTGWPWWSPGLPSVGA